jgi:hypothetical protein
LVFEVNDAAVWKTRLGSIAPLPSGLSGSTCWRARTAYDQANMTALKTSIDRA